MNKQPSKLIINIGDAYTTEIEKAVLRVADESASATAVTSIEDVAHLDTMNGKPPKFMVINLSHEALSAIEDAQRLQCYNRNTGSVILKGIADIHYLCEEGNTYEEVGLNHDGNIEVFEGEIYAVDSTAHGAQIIQSCEPVPIKSYNPDDEINIRWHIDDIINCDDDIFITTETARSIMQELRVIDARGDSFGHTEIYDKAAAVSEIPEDYRNIAERFGINQNYKNINLNDRPLNSVVFFELIDNYGFSPADIEKSLDTVIEHIEVDGMMINEAAEKVMSDNSMEM